MTLRPCPYCGSEMIGNMTSPICRNPKCEFCDIPIPLQYVEDMHKLRNAINVALKILDAAGKLSVPGLDASYFSSASDEIKKMIAPPELYFPNPFIKETNE